MFLYLPSLMQVAFEKGYRQGLERLQRGSGAADQLFNFCTPPELAATDRSLQELRGHAARCEN